MKTDVATPRTSEPGSVNAPPPRPSLNKRVNGAQASSVNTIQPNKYKVPNSATSSPRRLPVRKTVACEFESSVHTYNAATKAAPEAVAAKKPRIGRPAEIFG